MRIALVVGLVAWWMAVASVTSAQYATVALESYGRGVHAHFSGDSLPADQYLTHAIETNPRDPRPYYFRALNRLKLGRTPEALDDFGDGRPLLEGDDQLPILNEGTPAMPIASPYI